MKDEFNEQTNHMRFLPDNEFNIDSATRDWVIHFTPSVPTEDGWYVCNVLNAYYIVQVRDECTIGFKPSTILSHAKLPEL